MQQVNIQELCKSRLWPRTTLDMEKLGQLVWSMLSGGFRDEANVAIVYEVVDGQKQIRFGHRRTLAYVLASKWQDAVSVEEIVNRLYATSVGKKSTIICPICGAEVSPDDEDCPNCGHTLLDTEGGFTGVSGEVDTFDPAYFITHYDEVIHSVDGSVPAVEAPYENDLQSLLSLLGDNRGREDDDIVGTVQAVAKAVREGATARQIAALGIAEKDMNNYVALATAPAEILSKVAAGELHPSVAYVVNGLPDSDMRTSAYRYILEYGLYTQQSILTAVRNLKNYHDPEPTLDSSQLWNNYCSIFNAVVAGMDDYLYHRHIMQIGIIPNHVIMNCVTSAMYEQVGKTCSTCQLAGLMSQLPRVEGRTTYPCQEDNGFTRGCLLYGPQVLADYRVLNLADVHYEGDNTNWFSTFELAQTAYNSLVAENAAEVATDQRPIDAQRERIRTWIEQHTSVVGRVHPVATLCSNCKYATTESPVRSDPTAPHCAWAGKRANLVMGFLQEIDGPYRIPLCKQYAPTADIKSLIQETDPGDMPGEILDELVMELAGVLMNQRKAPLEFLVGVPFSASEHGTDWFVNRFRQGGFTAGEKTTLLQWLMFEIGLHQRGGKLRLPAGRVATFGFEVL